jgi:hypothetical protein
MNYVLLWSIPFQCSAHLIHNFPFPAGVVVLFEEIQSTVTDVLNENMEAIVEQRYRINGLGSTSPSFTSVLLFFTLFSLLMWDCKN